MTFVSNWIIGVSCSNFIRVFSPLDDL